MRRGPPARSTKAKARIDRYHRLLDDAPEVGDGELAFSIPAGPRLGTRVLRAWGVTIEVGERTLVRDLDLDVGRGERLGIVGPNGAGKTTLLRVLTGLRPPEAGSVEVGETVRLAAVDQRRSDLDPGDTVIDAITGGGSSVNVGGRTIRAESFLEGFLFPGERKHARVDQLSGGERNRVLLARLLLQGGNVLVLDEPTNDLDLPTLRALEEALIAFEGSVIVVSHDRWFLDRVATEILHLDGRGNVLRFGDSVTALLERAAQERAADERRQAAARARAAAPAPSQVSAPVSDEPPAKKPRRLTPWQEKELAALPAKLEAAEARLEALTARIAEPSLYAGPAAERERVQAEQAEAQTEVETLYARWEELESIGE